MSIEAKRAHLFVRQPLSTPGKIAFWTFLVGAISGIGGTVALTITNGSPSRDIVITMVCGLVGTVLVASGIRWMQVIATLVGVYILYMLFTEPFVIESLANPKGPNGGFGHFAGDVLIIAIAILAFVANIGTVLQNYHWISYQKPRQLAPAFSIIGGMIIGALFIGALAPPPAPVATLQNPRIPAGPGVPTSVNMGMTGAPIAVTQLQAPATTAHVDHFTLTAQTAQLALDSNTTVPAWTFNGTAPGPTLHVRQGDEVVVTLVNHLSFGVTIHWHGVRVPNAADGVAGVTQDAVKLGQSYVYRSIAIISYMPTGAWI